MQEENNSEPPFAGVHVVELGEGVAAPYAGQLLRLLGATVVKLERPDGDPSRHYPVDDGPLHGVSPLYLYLNSGKRNVAWTTDRLETALRWADVVIDSRIKAGAEPEILAAAARRDVRYAAVTAWGFDALDPGEIDDELLVQAQAGVLTLTGNVGAAPIRFPGFQSQYLAGAFAAAGVAASLLAGDAGATRIEVAWVSAIASGTEGSYQRYLHTRLVPVPAGANPTSAFPAGAFACADGFVVPGTVRQHDWEVQCLLYGRPDLTEDPRFGSPAARTANYEELWQEIQPWYDRHTRREVFSGALDLGWACGMVLDAVDALTDEHLEARGFLSRVSGDGRTWQAPGRLALGLDARSALDAVRNFGADSGWFDEVAAS